MELEIEEYLEDKFEKLRFKVVVTNACIIDKKSCNLDIEIKTKQDNIYVCRIYYRYDTDFTFEANMSLLVEKINRQSISLQLFEKVILYEKKESD